MKKEKIIIAAAQIAPVWMNKKETLLKVADSIKQAAADGCSLLAFGEAFVPGYPFWLEKTNGAVFNSTVQKEIFAYYAKQSVQIENGDLNEICEIAANKKITVVLGCVERAEDRGGHSLYCSLVYIGNDGQIKSVHRKLMPTYEERLVWSIGDGNGLRVHQLESFTCGCLNCWENWMPLVRASMYAQGENLRIAVWPGSVHNTEDITRFIAKEARSYVLSASVPLCKTDIDINIPHYELISSDLNDVITNGGSCLAAPDGSWFIEPQKNSLGIFKAEIDYNQILNERQNFDPSGHYSRPDVTKLTVNRTRQSVIELI